MKRLAWCIGACGLLALAAQAADDGAARRDAERARIASEREKAESLYHEREAACYRLFAVNDCLSEAQSVRRAALADLRRQEISLNDEERKLKGAQQRQRLDERVADQDERQQRAQQRALVRPVPPAGSAASGRLDAGQSSASAPRSASPEPGASQPVRPAAVPARSAAEQARARAAYEQRLREAQERKARVQERAERDQPAAQPLPVPR